MYPYIKLSLIVGSWTTRTVVFMFNQVDINLNLITHKSNMYPSIHRTFLLGSRTTHIYDLLPTPYKIFHMSSD